MNLATKGYTKADGESVPYVLTASVRADCCSARAIYKVTFPYGDLFFCNHHFNKNRESIIANSISIIDESQKLFN